MFGHTVKYVGMGWLLENATYVWYLGGGRGECVRNQKREGDLDLDLYLEGGRMILKSHYKDFGLL